jgi:hypothetical protein
VRTAKAPKAPPLQITREAHAAATPSAWDDTEKPNPAAPMARDDAL